MKSFYKKLIFPIVGIFILQAVAISIFAILSLRKEITPAMEEMNVNVLRSIAGEIEIWLDSHGKRLEWLAESLEEEVPSFLTEEDIKIMSRLEKYISLDAEMYDNLGIIYPNGEKYVTGGSQFSVLDRGYYSYLLSHPEEKTVKTIISDSRSNNKPILLIITRIGKEGAFLSAGIYLSGIEDVLKKYSNEYTQVYIQGINDEVILGTTGKENIKKILYEKEIPQSDNWKLILSMDQDYINQSIYPVISLILFISIVSVMVALLILRKKTKELTKPLETLEKTMIDSKGGVSEEIYSETNIQEIDNLWKSYQTMSENIHQLMEEIRVQENEKKEAENQALFMQIKPHFLYNTLETIQSLSYLGEEEEVRNAIAKLGRFFRLGLSDGKQIISLKDELAHIEAYLELLTLRYPEKIYYTVKHNLKEEEFQDIGFLRFTLQPLIENAFYHGVKLLEGQGEIIVEIFKEVNYLIIQVKNTRVPVEMERIKNINQLLKKNATVSRDEGGYGLYNVNQRLGLHFGPMYGISLEVTERYFITELKHPVLKEKEELGEYSHR